MDFGKLPAKESKGHDEMSKLTTTLFVLTVATSAVLPWQCQGNGVFAKEPAPGEVAADAIAQDCAGKRQAKSNHPIA